MLLVFDFSFVRMCRCLPEFSHKFVVCIAMLFARFADYVMTDQGFSALSVAA